MAEIAVEIGCIAKNAGASVVKVRARVKMSCVVLSGLVQSYQDAVQSYRDYVQGYRDVCKAIEMCAEPSRLGAKQLRIVS